MWDASPVLIKMPKVFFVDDGPGKPEGIDHFIGRRPIFAFGNSDADKEMLEWTAAGDGLRLMGLVHHTDAEREYAHDRNSDSDGDRRMLEWTAAGDGLRFMGLLHHTDAEWEYAYDRNSSVGKLDKALDEATAKGWIVVDMKNDWKTIFPPSEPLTRSIRRGWPETSPAMTNVSEIYFFVQLPNSAKDEGPLEMREPCGRPSVHR
jgi:hypothetical protein